MMSEFCNLNGFWFLTLGILLAGYAVLDGFDLGAGFLHLFAKKEEDKKAILSAVTPFWDGNEVWLVTFGGALFAAFPHAYATVFSGFYLAFMLLLFALIFRGVSVEFRNKVANASWHKFWDWSFGLSSAIVAVLFGVAAGNCLLGLPIDAAYEYRGSFLGLLSPYALLVGLLTLSMVAMHGTAFLYMKTESELHSTLGVWLKRALLAFVLLYLICIGLSLFGEAAKPTHVWLMASLSLIAILALLIAFLRDNSRAIFYSSALSIITLVFLFGANLFPNLVISSLNPEWSLNIYNAASSPKTLRIMQIITALGMPLVIVYTIVLYRVFKGKLSEQGASY